MQRIGRSRHQRKRSAQGLIVTNNPDDEIECIALIRRMQNSSVEQQPIHTKSLDVLCHHLVGLSLETRNEVNINSAFSIISKAYPFKNISLFTIEACLDILDKTGIIKYNIESKTFRRKLKSYKYYFENISMIPHILKFDVLDIISKKKIGTLDQKFVGDYCEKGNIFVLKGSQWRVISIDELKFQVNVEPLYGNKINVPYWVGELIPVDYYTCIKVGKIRNMIINNKITVDNSVLTDFFSSFKLVPDSHNIVVETSNTQNNIIIHSTFGTKINNTLSSLFSQLFHQNLDTS